MPTFAWEHCERCRELEQTHDEEMDAYIHLVDQQSRMFRIGHAQAGRDLDTAILKAKTKRQATIDALLAHQAAHQAARIPALSSARDLSKRRA